MRDKQIKRRFEKIKIPAYDIGKLEETISAAKRIKLYPEEWRMTNMEFCFNQIRFIRKRTWALKMFFSFSMYYLILTENLIFENWLWTLIAISGPVLCMINANEICNIFQPGMIEIQIAARNSCRKVLMIRLLIFGLADALLLICAASFMAIFKETAIWQIVIYSVVPYEIMCFGCMCILNRCREDEMLFYSGAWGVSLCCIIVILKISGLEIFETYCFSVWTMGGAAAMGGIVIELSKLLKKAGGNLNEINYGAFI